MKAIPTIAFLTVVLIATAAADLAKPVRILDEDIPHAAPFLADIDGDGKKDLLVGHFRVGPFTDARVKVFRNVGTLKAPRFDEGAWVKAGKAEACVDEFCHTGFGPQVIDFDGDGILDLISGSRDSLLNVFRGNDDGTFKPAVAHQYVPDKGERRNFAYNSRVFAHDWDGDGDLDLLVARYRAVSLIRNEGGEETPRFDLPDELVVRAPDSPALTVAIVADWDSDGRHDLIVGRSDGSVVWHRNDADSGNAEPVLEAAEIIVGKGLPVSVKMDFEGNFEAPQGPTANPRICIADYNDDGRPDLLLGDTWRTSETYDAEHPRPQMTAARKAAYERQKELRRVLAELEDAEVPENESKEARLSREEKITALKAEGAEAWQAFQADYHSSFGRHGSVWLFERLGP